MAMRFWGIEVKGNEPCKVSFESGYIVHVSQATLGDTKKDKENVIVHVKANDKKLVMGVLGQDSPQLSCDLVFDKEFEISHNWKNGSVHLIGYEALSGEPELDFDGSGSETDSEEEAVPILKENGQPAAPAIKGPVAKPKVENKPKPEVKDDEDDDSDSDDQDFDGDSDSEEGMDVDSSDESEDDDDDSEESEDEKPANVPEAGKKRPGADAKTPQTKKAKFATPEKSDSKKKGVVHPGTPYPKKGEKSQKTYDVDKTDSKKAGTSNQKKGGNTSAGGKSPVSPDSAVSCGSCKKTFKSEVALQSHSKAKHGAK